MKNPLSGLLACAALAWPLAAGAADQGASFLPGHYYLQGVMETGSELLLKKDGTFEWMLSYGSMDEQASGAWRVDGDVLTLVAAFAVTDAQWLRGQAFQKLALRVVDGGLKVDDADNGLARGLYVKPASKQ